MSRLYQLTEDELVTLEHEIPMLCSEVSGLVNSEYRTRFNARIRRLQAVLTNIRWQHQPWSNVGRIPCDGEPPSDEPEEPQAEAPA